MTNETLKAYHIRYFDDNGREKTHWLTKEQNPCFKNREDAVKHIEVVRSWNAIGFTQTLIVLSEVMSWEEIR